MLLPEGRGICPREQTSATEQCRDCLVRQKERSFNLLLVHRIIPKVIEFFLDHPADISPA